MAAFAGDDRFWREIGLPCRRSTAREKMAIAEHLQPGYGPIGLASSDGFPWARLVTGVFTVAISLAMSWRVGRMPVELARTEAPRPKQEQSATADLLDRREPEILKATALRETLSPPAAPTQVARKPARRPSGSPKPHQLQRMTTQAKVQSDLFAHRKAGVNPWSIDYNQIAQAKLTRRRSEVRNEYVAAREQVAALTGEDSGSTYLTRLAAGQSAARAIASVRRAGGSRSSPRGRDAQRPELAVGFRYELHRPCPNV